MITAVLGVTNLAILMLESDLAHLLMIGAHKEDYQSQQVTLTYSRIQAWIIKAYTLTRKDFKDCAKCTPRPIFLIQYHLETLHAIFSSY